MIPNTRDGIIRRIIDRGEELDRIEAAERKRRAQIGQVLLTPTVIGNVVTLTCPGGSYAYEVHERSGQLSVIPLVGGTKPLPGTDPEEASLTYAAAQAYLANTGRSYETPVSMDYRSALHADGTMRASLPAGEREMVAALMRMDPKRVGVVQTTRRKVLAEIVRHRMGAK